MSNKFGATAKNTTEKLSKITGLKPGDYTFVLLQKLDIDPKNPRQTPPYPRLRSLAAKIEVFDEDEKIPRQVRVVPGSKTIFVDEQIDQKINDKRADELAWSPEFIYGTLVLRSPQDDLKIQRMMLDDKFDGKKEQSSEGTTRVFTVIDESANGVASVSTLKEKRIATEMAWQAVEEDFDSIEAHAKFLGINYKDGNKDKPKETIISEYILKAGSDPAAFTKSFGSPIVELRNVLKTAVEKGIIDLGHVVGQAHWGETKGLITDKIDLSKPPLESLLAYATSTPGEAFKEKVKELVKK